MAVVSKNDPWVVVPRAIAETESFDVLRKTRYKVAPRIASHSISTFVAYAFSEAVTFVGADRVVAWPLALKVAEKRLAIASTAIKQSRETVVTLIARMIQSFLLKRKGRESNIENKILDATVNSVDCSVFRPLVAWGAESYDSRITTRLSERQNRPRALQLAF